MKPGMRLLSLNSEHLMRRIAADADSSSDDGEDGEEDTAPERETGEGELRLEFDRPMSGAVALTGEAPEVVAAPRWEQDGRVLVVPVRFAAGSRHVLQINDEIEPGQGFRGKDGQWLVPREWRFTVEAAEGE